MNENIESVKKYNLWVGNTIDCVFPRPLYTESIASYLGSKVSVAIILSLSTVN